MLQVIITILALPAWLLGLLLPLAWLTAAAALQLSQPFAESMRYVWQPRLHAVSLLLMTLSALVAVSLAIVAAYAFARLARLSVIWVTAGVLVIPPLVYGYLWFVTLGDLVALQPLPIPTALPVQPGNLALAAWAVGLWLWPIPALLLTAGWQWTGKPAWLLARLDAGDAKAFLRAALPAMRSYLVAAFAVALLLAAQEYAIPALFSVQTWQTQWLALAKVGIPLGQLALGAMPAAGLLLILIVLFVRFWRAVESLGPADLGPGIVRGRARLYGWLILGAVLGLALAAPALGSLRTLTRGVQASPGRFAVEFQNTPIVMAAAATLALAGALPLVRRPWRPSGNRVRGNTRIPQRRTGTSLGQLRFRLMLAMAAVAWVLPVGLLAEATLQAQTWLIAQLDGLSRQIPALADRLGRFDLYATTNLILWVSILAGRLLPIAWLLLMTVARSLPAHLTEQAAVDGATSWQTSQMILLPLLLPAAGAAWLICGLLAAADTAAAVMLQPPGFDVLSVSLLNQMHYGRDADVVATCLVMLAGAAGAAAVIAVLLGRTTAVRD